MNKPALGSRAIIVIVLMAILGLGIMLTALRYASSEEARERIIWQNSMSVVINGRADVMSKWVEQQKETIRALSENPSLKLYFNNLTNDLGLVDPAREAIQEYIQPLLNDRANQNGFSSVMIDPEFDVRANVKRESHAGIALTNLQGNIVVSTANMPSVLPAVTEYLSSGANQDTILIGPYDGESGFASVAIITPVFGIDDDLDDPARGFLVGVKLLDQSFFDLLIQPGEVTQTARNYLIQKQDGFVHYLSGYRKTAAAYPQPMDEKTEQLAASFAYDNPGSFDEKIDRFGESVIVSGKIIEGTDWVLVRTVNRSEALGSAADKKRNIIVFTLLVLIGLGVTSILIWRHGVSVRLVDAVKKQKELTAKYEKLNKFMSTVTDSHSAAIFVVDEQGKYTFVNTPATKLANSTRAEMLNKKPTAVFGDSFARIDEMCCQQALLENKALTKVQNDTTMNLPTTIKTNYLPLISDDNLNGHGRGVLMVKEDITDQEQDKHRKEVRLKSLISMLTRIIGSRDPYSAEHSERVVIVVKKLSEELEVEDTVSATAELAGAMMNLGKILVPRELLTKPDQLNDDELDIIRSSMLKSAELIKEIEFEGPVQKTLEQIQAHWDGTGYPEGLSGDKILPSARIVAVANAFVAMISKRAHRPGMSMEKAVKLLMENADTVYDRRPIIALMNYLENKGGLEEWEYFNSPAGNS